MRRTLATALLGLGIWAAVLVWMQDGGAPDQINEASTDPVATSESPFEEDLSEPAGILSTQAVPPLFKEPVEIASAEASISGSLATEEKVSETDQDESESAAAALTPQELSLKLDAIWRAPGNDAAEEGRALLRRWTELDPESAADWALTLEKRSPEAVGMVIGIWAGRDLSGATAWVNAMPQGAEKAAAVVSLAYETARDDPKTALTEAGALPPSVERDRLLAHSLTQWAGGDSEEALRWAEAVPDAVLREKLVAAVAVVIGAQDARMAADVVSANLSPGVEQDRAAVAVVQRWAESSPGDAAAWVAEFPDTPARAAALESLVINWTLSDNAALRAWLSALPDGPLRQLGLQIYTRVTGNLN